LPTEKNIKSPEALYELFTEYKSYCKANPKKENFFNHKTQKQDSIDREVPLTWQGFEVFLFKKKVISRLEHYKANTDGAYSEYLDIIKAINDEIYEDKFGGATAGIYQHNIIARDLGLTDKQDVTVKAEQPLFDINE
jgi:hypothetical protein